MFDALSPPFSRPAPRAVWIAAWLCAAACAPNDDVNSTDTSSATDPDSQATAPDSQVTDPDSQTTDPDSQTTAPDTAPCWEFRLVVDDQSRTPAQALAPRPGGLLLGGTPSNRGIALLNENEVSWEQPTVLPDGGFVKDVAPLGGEGAFAFGWVPSFQFATGQAVWMGRVDTDGELLWSRSLASAHFNAWAHVDARVHPDGGFFVSADDGFFEGGQALVLMHVDDEGETVWATQYPLAPQLHVAINWSLGAMDALPAGGVVQLTAANDGIRVIRTDPAGGLVWDREYTGTGWPRDIVALPDGGIAALASTVDTANLLRLDGDGEVVAMNSYQEGPGSNATALAHNPDGGFLLAGGTSATEGPPGTRTWLVVTDAAGAVEWDHVGELGTPGHVHEVRSTGPGAYALTAHGEHLWVATVTACDPS